MKILLMLAASTVAFVAASFSWYWLVVPCSIVFVVLGLIDGPKDAKPAAVERTPIETPASSAAPAPGRGKTTVLGSIVALAVVCAILFLGFAAWDWLQNAWQSANPWVRVPAVVVLGLAFSLYGLLSVGAAIGGAPEPPAADRKG